jgi:galactonate dehydratase
MYDRLTHLMGARGHVGSFLIDAVAGLDTALWDLKARKYGVPLFELLGGPFRLELPAYVSGLRFKTLEERLTAAKKFVADGYAGVKIFSGANVSDVEAEVRELRKVLGPESFLAFDAICRYDLGTATRLGRTLDAVGAAWFEAPLDAEDIEGHAALARAIATPVAVGETLRTPRQFAPWLSARSLAVAQPDVMRAGVTGALKIADLAQAHHVPTTLHTGVCTGIGMAATWQVAAALQGTLPQEHQHDLFAVVSKFLATPLTCEGGKLVVPTRAGLGVDVNEAAVREHATEAWLVDETGRRRTDAGGR